MLMNARDKETGDAMSERELIDEVMTLVVAGHETTASALNWTWYLLSQHPEVEAKLHAELDAAPVETAPGLAQMEALKYTHAVIDEALRLYPPGWILSRRTIAADTLGGYEVPGRHERDAEPLRAPPAPEVLEGSGQVLARALRCRNTTPTGRVSRTCRSPRVRATASAKPSPFTKC